MIRQEFPGVLPKSYASRQGLLEHELNEAEKERVELLRRKHDLNDEVRELASEREAAEAQEGMNNLDAIPEDWYTARRETHELEFRQELRELESANERLKAGMNNLDAI